MLRFCRVGCRSRVDGHRPRRDRFPALVRVRGSDDAVILVAIYLWVLRIEVKPLHSNFRFPALVTEVVNGLGPEHVLVGSKIANGLDVKGRSKCCCVAL